MKSNCALTLLATCFALSLPAYAGTQAKYRDLDRDGITNSIDPDVDNDGILNGDDLNVDGGKALSGPFAGRYIGDRYNNDSPKELDIDDDGVADNSLLELDIDGDGLPDDSTAELDIDGDGRSDSDAGELNTDGDQLADRLDLDDDGDGIQDRDDNDDDGDHSDDLDDDDHDGAVLPLVTGPVGDGVAPADLTGLAYLLQRSGKAEIKRVEFVTDSQADEVETEKGRVKREVMSYTYAANGTTGQVVLTEKPSEYEILTLDFSTGMFTRQEYERGHLDETKTGTFTVFVK